MKFLKQFKFLKVIFYFRILFLIGFFYYITNNIILAEYSDDQIFMGMAIWLIIILLYKFGSQFNIAIALILLIVCSVLYTLKLEKYSEITAVWSFMIFLTGTIVSIVELRFTKLKLFNFKKSILTIINGQDIILYKKFILKTYKKLKYIIKIYLKIIYEITFISLKMPKKLFYQNHKIVFHYYFKEAPKMAILFFLRLIIFVFFLISLHWLIIRSGYLLAEVSSLTAIKRQRLSMYPTIKKYEPKLVYYGNKLIIWGHSFGEKRDQYNRIFTNYGNLNKEIHLWTSTKIIINIPVHWKPGEVEIWVQKPVTWKNKTAMISSNKAKIKLLPVNTTMSTDDEEYYEQLKHLDKETLKINEFDSYLEE